MKLPVKMPFAPMEAKIAGELPDGPEWEYEPKWDGFRCIAFRNGKEAQLQSKAGRPLTRYFPEVVRALLEVKADRYVLDGELIVPVDRRLSFDDLLQRIHPAASRVNMLAETHPAQLVTFDLLVDERGDSLVEKSFEERRRRLQAFYDSSLKKIAALKLSQATRSRSVAEKWMAKLRGQLDGIVAKRIDQPYMSGERAMVKVKNIRSADCVVGGFRYASGKRVVGSLLLGLYDREGKLNHVGFTSGISAAERRELTSKLEKLIEPPGFTGAAPGGPSRWSTDRSAEWQPLKPRLVAEVQYDHFTGDRFRHGTRLLRWRPDKPAKQCTMEQVAMERSIPFKTLLVS